MKAERVFQILSIMLLAIAGYFYWQDNFDGIFFFLVTSASSFFLSLRFQARTRLSAEKTVEAADRKLHTSDDI